MPSLMKIVRHPVTQAVFAAVLTVLVEVLSPGKAKPKRRK